MTDTTTSHAPLRFALVPVDPTSEMARRGRNALSDNGADNMEVNDDIACHAAMIAASPGNDLLQRIVMARDNPQSVRNCRWSEACDVMDAVGALADVLNELGGCDG